MSLTSERKIRCVNRSWLSKCCFSFIAVLSLICGLDFGSLLCGCSSEKHGTARKWLCIPFRLFFAMNLIFHVIQTGLYISLRVSVTKQLSATDIFTMAYYFCDLLLIAQTARSLWQHQEALRHLFRTEHLHPFHGTIFAAWFYNWLTSILYNLIHAILTTKRVNLYHVALTSTYILGLWSSVHVRQVECLAIIIYMQGQVILRCRLRQADLMFTSTVRTVQLSKVKADIRGITSSLNATFGTFLALLYLQVFSRLYIVFVDEVAPFKKVPVCLRVMRHINLLFLACGLYYMACVGSDVIKLCRRTAYRSACFELSMISSKEQIFLRRTLAYDDQQDALTIFDCFVHSKATLVSYLGMLVTCMGVLLQFDYKLMATFDRSKLTVLALNMTTK